MKRLAAVLSTLAVSAALVAPAVRADVVPVDPGPTLSAGKPIFGSGQNLPSLGAVEIFNVGPGPADQVRHYYESGQVVQDQADVAAAALRWSKKWLVRTCGGTKRSEVRKCKAAAVFDIDDTLISSYPVLSTNNPVFDYNEERSNAAIATCSDPVIAATKRLFKQLRRMGISVALITGRPDSQRADTVSCLNSLGVSGWSSLTMRSAGDKVPASVYKSRARKALEKKGWKIGPSIGDQISDMSYGHLGHGFLVPNPMYLIP